MSSELIGLLRRVEESSGLCAYEGGSDGGMKLVLWSDDVVGAPSRASSATAENHFDRR